MVFIQGVIMTLLFVIIGLYVGTYMVIRTYKIERVTAFVVSPLTLVITLIAMHRFLLEMKKRDGKAYNYKFFLYCFPMCLNDVGQEVANVLRSVEVCNPTVKIKYRKVSKKKISISNKTKDEMLSSLVGT